MGLDNFLFLKNRIRMTITSQVYLNLLIDSSPLVKNVREILELKTHGLKIEVSLRASKDPIWPFLQACQA